MQLPMVSVIVPTYKGSEKISNTLVSLQQQTYSNFEVIVVDDNGRGTPEQLNTELALQNFPKVRYIVHDVNKNGSAARNTGIHFSQGEYLTFLDDDDTWLETKIEEQVKTLSSLTSEWGAVYCPYVAIESNDEAYLMGGEGLHGYILYDYLVERAKIASSTIMIRKDILETIHGFDESFRRHQDWEFITRIAATYKIAFTNKTLTFKHDEIRRNSPKRLSDIIDNRIYYLDKMKVIISNLSSDEQKNVYSYHYCFLAKECLRRKQFLQCIAWLKKSGYPVANACKLTKDIVKYFNKKHNTQSCEEIIKEWENV